MKKTNKNLNQICKIRNLIDKVDLQLVKLLNQRAKYAQNIGKLKLKIGLQTYSPTREQQVISNIIKANKGPISKSAIKCLFQHIIEETRSVEHLTMQKSKIKSKNNECKK